MHTKSGGGVKQSTLSNLLRGEGANLSPRTYKRGRDRVFLKQAVSEYDKIMVNRIIKSFHSYVPQTKRVGRYIDWLIMYNNQVVGAIGIMDTSAFTMGVRDRFIGWNTEQRKRNIHKIVVNYRFTLLPTAPKNLASKVLSLLVKICGKQWKEKYGREIVLLEALVKPPRRGICYKAAGWRLIGMTYGSEETWHGFQNRSEGRIAKLKFKGQRLYYFIKPLVKDYLKRLKE